MFSFTCSLFSGNMAADKLKGQAYVESNEGPIKTPVLGLRTLQP